MGLVSTWLKTVGLGHVVPAFRMAGINTPTALAQLEMRDYEELGVTDWNDKRKLLYLVQRIQVARDDNKKTNRTETSHNSEEEYYSHDEEDDELEESYLYEREQQKPRTPSQTAAAALAEWSAADENEQNPDMSSNSTLPSPPEYSDHDQYEEDFEDYELMDEKIQRRERERQRLHSGRNERPSSSNMRLLKTNQSQHHHRNQRNLPKKQADYYNDSSEQFEDDEEGSHLYNRSYNSSSRNRGKNVEDYDSYLRTTPLNSSRNESRKSMSFDGYQNNHRDYARGNEYTNQKDIFKKHQKLKPLNSKKSFSRQYQNEEKDQHDDHQRSPSLRSIRKSHSYSSNDFDIYVESPDFEPEHNTRPSTSYSRSKSRTDRAGHASNSNRTRSSFQTSSRNMNSRQYSRDESPRSNSRSVKHFDEETNERHLTPSPPPSRASSRRMSQRLKERNMRTKLRRDVERQSSYKEEQNFNLHNDDSDNSRNSNYSRSRNNNRHDHRNIGRAQRSYLDEEDYDEEYSDDNEDNEGSIIDMSRDKLKKNSRKSILTMTSPIMTSKSKDRRRLSTAHSAPTTTSPLSNPSSKGSHREGKSRAKPSRQNKDNRSQRQSAERGTRSSHREEEDNFAQDSQSNHDDDHAYSVDRSIENSKGPKNHSKSTKIPSLTNSSQRRRIQSNIQNPSISYRNGNKMLSTIPSEKVAPMSPLVDIAPSKLDKLHASETEGRSENNENTDEMERKVKSGKARSKLRRESSKGSGEYKASAASKRGKSDRRLSAPIDQSSFDEDQDQFDEERSLLSKERSNRSLRLDRRTSTGSLSSQSTTSRRSYSRSDPTISKSMLQNTRSLRRRAARQKSFDEAENKDDEMMDQSLSKKKKDHTPVFVHGVPEDNSWSTQVSRLREDIGDEYDNDIQVREEDEAMEMRIRVVVRKRPMSKKEASANDVDVIHPIDDKGFGRIAVYQAKIRVDLTKEVETLKFSYDNVFGENSNNNDIYNRAVRHLIPGVFEGQWASIFAYGQTGSGKTYTMMGCDLTGNKAGTQSRKRNQNQGLYYSAAQDVFHLAKLDQYKHLSVGVSLFEIYGGKLFDLLSKRKVVKCLEDHKGKVCFPGLSEHPISNPDQLLKMIETGASNRSTGTTSANADSSRSHAVLMLCLRKRVGRKGNVEHGRLSFIDLAGSERGADTAKACRTTRMEGAEINTSLLALKEVIRALATGDSMKHIPFRGSKLTQVLKESFVGKNSRTVMVACVAPNMNNCDHTLNTLRYADRVKERDPETGKLSDKIMAASKIMKKVSSVSLLERPSTAPSTSLERKMSMKRIDKSKSPIKPITKFEENLDEEVEWSSEDEPEDETAYSETNSHDEQKYFLPQSSDEEETSPEKIDTQSRNRVKLKEASSALINTHRNVMTGMLNTVKHEMALVNSTDADRNSIDDYLVDLERVLENNNSMITNLRESLMEYYAVRGEMHHTDEKKLNNSNQINSVIDDDGLLSDDTFEDLRD